MKKTIIKLIGFSLCFILLLSIISFPLEAGPCERGAAKCMFAALISGGAMSYVSMFCVVGYAICVQYY